jgi:hypothetical protein
VAAKVLPLLEAAPGQRFSEPNRWGSGELEQAAVRPELVVEVRYDKVQGNRFRHGTKLIRWRSDKDPKDCTWRELRPPKAAGSVEALGQRHVRLAVAPRDMSCTRLRYATVMWTRPKQASEPNNPVNPDGLWAWPARS